MCIHTNIHVSVAFPVLLPIDWSIKLVNIAFQSVLCIHAEKAILGDDVRAASHRLIFLLKYRDHKFPMIALYYVQMWK